MSQNARVWEDPDEEPEFTSREDPEWLQRRRKLLEAGEEVDLDSLPKLSGTLARIKAGKFKTGVRFRISPTKPTDIPIKVKGGIRTIQFDRESRFMAVLGLVDNTMRLYSPHFNTQSQLKFKKQAKMINFKDVKPTGLAVKDDSILVIGKATKLIKYDIPKGKAIDVATLTVPRTDSGFSAVCTANYENYYAISCIDTGSLLVCDFKDDLLIHSFTMNSPCVGMGFIENTLVSCAADSTIYEFDLVAGRCRRQFKDSNSAQVSIFSACDSRETPYFATGTTAGYVNLYTLGDAKPFKITDMHLDERFTLFTSRHKTNAVRVAHNATLQVVANWPRKPKVVGMIANLSYSKKLNTIATGTVSGTVRLYRVRT